MNEEIIPEYEPSMYELIELDRRTDQAMLDFFGFIDRKVVEAQPDFLDELAFVAWIRFVSGAINKNANRDPFRSAVRSVLPSVSSFHYDAREISRMMFHEVASRLSKMLWEGRRQKDARKRAQRAKKCESRPERRERLKRIAESGVGKQAELGLKGVKNAASETPIASLPPQTEHHLQIPDNRERNLVMPVIEAEVYFQCLRPLAQQKEEELMAQCVSDTLQVMHTSETTVELAARSVAYERGIPKLLKAIVRRTNEFLDAHPSYIRAVEPNESS
ncbi:MAG: hypothetical protein Q8L64_04950 [bacterium]|nr:hypothetical protein [bacterium]